MKLEKSHYNQKRLLKAFLPHIVFFWLRIFAFFTIYILGANFQGQKKSILETADYFIYIFQFNAFQLYTIGLSLAHENIFGFNLSIAIMVHNTVLAIFIPATTTMMSEKKYWAMSIFIAALFFLEALFSSYKVIKSFSENSMQIFRKIGADEKINDAFATRKSLEVFGGINVFLATVIAGKVFLPPTSRLTPANMLIFGFMLLTYIQQIFVSVHFNEENRLQRIIAVVLAFLMIATAAGVITKYSVTSPGEPGYEKTRSILIYLFGDIIVITIIMNYFLIKDTSKFGSGLRELLLFKTQKISLDDEYK